MTEVMRPGDTGGAGTEPETGPGPDVGHAEGAHREPAVQAARMRRSAAVPRTVAIVLAGLVVGMGVVAGQEAVAASGAVGGLVPEDGWVTGAANGLEGAALGPSALLAGAVAVVLGVLLLWAAWHSGPRYTRLQPAPAVVLRPKDVARLASAAAEDVDGVLGASSTASARRVTVRVESTGAEHVRGEVEQAVGRRLQLLASPPSVRVRAR
ncbi:DUF6286 domain-containing protein [Isoptericola croceus]|uniref:DUF6286 domain-containing protein n=1 Tax=Isoptericola croceus TaxID=3031406 RepID=UPI0023F98D2E|nr:DUF6286 domain-containing protein [Isoptericola croceus]